MHVSKIYLSVFFLRDMSKVNWSNQLFAAVALATVCQLQAADLPTFAEDTLKRLNVSSSLNMMNEESFGVAVDLNHGGISARATDLVLPGNGPEIRISRTFLGENYKYHRFADMGDWAFDKPYIYTTVATSGGYSAHSSCSWGEGRPCSGNLMPSFYSYMLNGVSDVLDENNFWNGDFIHLPGYGESLLLETVNNTNGYTRKTTNNIALKCIDIQDPVSGKQEGFLAITPDGTTYKFERTATRAKSFLDSLVAGNSKYLGFLQKMLFATEVTDRFGNWVKYNYGSNTRIESISASDGRLVEFEYLSAFQNKVSAIKVNGLRFEYAYKKQGITTTLIDVKQPDGKHWSYDLVFLSDLRPKSTSSTNLEVPCEIATINADDNAWKVSVSNPYGGVLRFKLKCQRFGRANVYPPSFDKHAYKVAPVINSFAVTDKQLETSSGESFLTTYQYFSGLGFYQGEAKAAKHRLVLPVSMPSVDVYTTSATMVTDAKNNTQVHYISRDFTSTYENKTMYSQHFNALGELVSLTETTYGLGQFVGMFELFGDNMGAKSSRIVTARTEFTQSNNTYRTDYLDFDSFGYYRKKQTYNSDGTNTVWNYGYQHDEKIT